MLRPHRVFSSVQVRRPLILLSLISILLLMVSMGGQLTSHSTEKVHAASSAAKFDPHRPVLAFYYSWYNTNSWCSCTMSDLPQKKYNSSDDATVKQQITQAVGAGITGFINSWWGKDDPTDKNFARLLKQSTLVKTPKDFRFVSTLYIESDAPKLNNKEKMIQGLKYALDHYSQDRHFFRWYGKPVLFFWNPLGNGRTMADWAYIRSKVDPQNKTVWSVEGVDVGLLKVFDGLHLFSAGYWGLQNGNMKAVDQGFRDKISDYNRKNHTSKIWAAGVTPGFDDTRVPGRQNTVVVQRNNGKTYQVSWDAAVASKPEWVTITSFNEWFEGSMIEPSKSYGDKYLKITGQYATRWHG